MDDHSYSVIYSVYEVVHATGAASFRGIFLFHALLIALLTVFSLFLPANKFKEGDLCGFGRLPRQTGWIGWISKFPWIGFYIIHKEAGQQKLYSFYLLVACVTSLLIFLSSFIFDLFRFLATSTLALKINSEKELNTTDSAPNVSSGTPFPTIVRTSWNEFKSLVISKKYIFISLTQIFWYFTATFYIASIRLQLKSLGFRIIGGSSADIIAEYAPELIDIDPDIAAMEDRMNRIFNFCIWSGSVSSILCGAIVDRWGFPPSMFFQLTVILLN